MKPSSVPGKKSLQLCTWIWPAWFWVDAHYRPSPGSQTIHKACMPRPTMPYWSPVACTPVTGAMACLPISSWVAPCCCPGTWHPKAVMVWPTYPPRHLGTVKASLRFAKPLPVTITLIAYVRYDNLVVVDAYENPRQLGHWSTSTLGTNPGPCLHGSRLPTWSTRLMAGLLGNTGWVFSLRTLSMPSTLIPMAPH